MARNLTNNFDDKKKKLPMKSKDKFDLKKLPKKHPSRLITNLKNESFPNKAIYSSF